MVYPKVVMLGAVCGNFREKMLRGQWSLMWKLAHFDGTCQQNPSPKKTTKNCVCQQKKHHIFSMWFLTFFIWNLYSHQNCNIIFRPTHLVTASNVHHAAATPWRSDPCLVALRYQAGGGGLRTGSAPSAEPLSFEASGDFGQPNWRTLWMNLGVFGTFPLNSAPKNGRIEGFRWIVKINGNQDFEWMKWNIYMFVRELMWCGACQSGSILL